MAYIINVAKKATESSPPIHVFRTARDSIRSCMAAVTIAQELKTIYPPETHTVEVMRESTITDYVDF